MLNYEQPLFIRVRYRDSKGRVSGYSEPLRVVTELEPRVLKPVVLSPSSPEIEYWPGLTVTSTQIAQINSTGIHQASDWQIATDSGFTEIVESSLGDVVNLTSFETSLLQYETMYYVRVRHQDSVLGWSPWSDTVSFTTTIEPRILKPSVTSPSQNAQNLNTTVTFSASAFQVANSSDTHTVSDWEVSTTSDFLNVVSSSYNSETHKTSWTVTELPYGTTLYARVRYGGQTLAKSPWSDTLTFTVKVQPLISTPSIVSPVSGATGVGIEASLISSAFALSAGEDTFVSTDWQVSTSSDFLNIVFESLENTVDKTTIALPDLSYDTLYYARVRYRASEAPVSNWSSTINFRIELEPAIVTPSVVYPSDDATGLGRNITLLSSSFQTINSTDAHVYSEWEIATDEAFLDVVEEASAAEYKTSFPVTLDYGTHFYARVRHYGNVLGFSDWSSVVDFTIEVQPSVDAPEITAPTHLSTGLDITGFDIEASAFTLSQGTDTHESSQWQIATDAGFTTLVVNDTSTSSLTSYSFLPGGYGVTYYVRVRYHGEKESSNWSSVVQFTIELEPAIVKPSIMLPVNGASQQSIDTTLTSSAFQTVNSSDTHEETQWQIATNAGFTEGLQSITSATSLTSISAFLLAYATTYYVRVRYEGSILGWGPWSDTSTFTTKAQPIIAKPSLTSHTNAQSGVSVAPTFAMTVGADSHVSTQWQVSTLSDFSILAVDYSDTDENKTSHPVSLIYDTTYYVRLRHYGNEAPVSDWSNTIMFTTELQPMILTPSISAPTGSNHALSVNASSSAYSVQNAAETHLNSDWQLASDSGFTEIVQQSLASETNKTSWSLTSLTYGATYYLRVRYRGSGGMLSSWSAPVTFTTRVEPIIATPTLSAPANNSVGVSVTPTLTSTPFTMAQGADIHHSTVWQIATDSNFTNLVVDVTSTTNKTSYTVS